MFIEMIVVIEMFFIVRHSRAAGRMKVNGMRKKEREKERWREGGGKEIHSHTGGANKCHFWLTNRIKSSNWQPEQNHISMQMQITR